MEQVEGRASVLAALAAYRRRFQVVLLREGTRPERAADVLDLAGRRGVPVRYVPARELDEIAHGATHGGVIAICSPRPLTTREELLALVDRLLGGEGEAAEPPLLLLLEGIDDARNLGFALRSAEALGVHAVLVKRHLWDFDPVEVARPASGAYERLPIVRVEGLDVARDLKARGVRVVGCLAGARRAIHEIDLAAPALLAIGGEKRGLSGALRALCDAFASIPTRAGAASLPLSHAACLVVGEAMRQRRAPRGEEHRAEGASSGEPSRAGRPAPGDAGAGPREEPGS